MTRSLTRLATALAVALVLGTPVLSGAADDQKTDDQKKKGGAHADAAGSPAPAATATDEDDAVLRLAEPDFSLIALPTSLRLPKFKSQFRVTHRFARPISCDSCTEGFFASGLGIDDGANIGLEYRVGIVPNGQIGIHRTSRDKTIELFGQYGLTRQGAKVPVETAALAALDVAFVGVTDAPSHYSPVLGLIVTRLIGDVAALHVEPIWVNNTNPLPSAVVDHNSTFMVGLGARVRIRPTVYVVAELTPRVAGFRPGANQGGFAIEKRAGGHMFQLNFSTALGTAFSQIARGGEPDNDWHMGFNITRKFF